MLNGLFFININPVSILELKVELKYPQLKKYGLQSKYTQYFKQEKLNKTCIIICNGKTAINKSVAIEAKN